jgi:pentatricopeptide repeat protein
MAAMAPGIVQLSIFGWNQNLTKYVKDGQPEKAMQLFHQMQHEAMSPDKFTFVQGIGTCEMRARAEGTGTISTNATGGCVTRLCYFCGGVDCTCQHGCT